MTTQNISLLKYQVKRFDIKENDKTGSIYIVDRDSYNTYINETEMARLLKQGVSCVSEYVNKNFKHVSKFYDEIKTLSRIQLTGCRLLHGDFIYYHSSIAPSLIQLQIKNSLDKLSAEESKKLELLRAFLHLGVSTDQTRMNRKDKKYLDIISSYNLKTTQDYTYFILDRNNNKIKIGYSCNPLTRLKSLQQASSMPLELIHTMPGGYWLEQSLHARFRKDRIHSEWFNYNKDIEAFLFSRSVNPYIL